MEDKVILKVLFNNSALRANLIGYESYVCQSDIACSLIETYIKYFNNKQKIQKTTEDDIDTLFKTAYKEQSEELLLWEEVKKLDLSDIDIIEPVVIKNIKSQIKDYFFAEAFSEDNYDKAKLEELYSILSKLDNLKLEEENIVEDISFNDLSSLSEIYSSKNDDGLKFFDERISDTLSTKHFDYGTINVITAPPGNGKTMVILNQSIYVANQGKTSLHLAIGDLTKKQLLIRILAIITEKPMQQISLLGVEKFGEFVKRAANKYPEIFKNLKCKTILPNTLNGLDLIKLIEEEQKTKNIHFDQIVVDYDGNVETAISSHRKNTDSSKTMYYEGADIYNNFAAFAKKNNSVVWMLSQPKIQYWGSEKIPLEGLNDSSKKQHIVDFIMSIGRKIQTEPKLTFYISKNRHGESNKTFYAQMDGSTQVIKPIKSWGEDEN